tara:strand:+ start:2122 stop:2628 length:507 start_codon:yes stop_codon:yes gene_type:complete
MQYQLNIKVLSNDSKVLEYYQNYELNNDSGIDLIIPENGVVKLGKTFTIDHQVQCSMHRINDNINISSAYWLVPRSSISKTNFRMANSIGLIDKDYRGNIKAKVDLIVKPSKITVEKLDTLILSDNILQYSRMFQIVTPDLSPISKINIVNELDSTKRGNGAFGSTGI